MFPGQKLLIIWLLAFPNILFAGEISGKRVQINWLPPQSIPLNETDYLDVLYFEDAIYDDAWPTLPLFIQSSAIDVPFFSWMFFHGEKVFEAVTALEDSILRASGYQADSISIENATRWLQGGRESLVLIFPFRYNKTADYYEKLVSFTLYKQMVYDKEARATQAVASVNASVLAEGQWYKVCVDETGIFRLGYDDLVSMGVNLQNLQKQQLGLFGRQAGMLPEANAAFVQDDLKEIPIYISGASSGTFGQDDYILFYGESPNTWSWDSAAGVFRHQVHLYTKEGCYFLTTNRGQGRRVMAQESLEAEASHQVTSYRFRDWHQRDLQNLIGSGQVWFGEVFDATTTRRFDFDIPDMVRDKPGYIELYVAARAPVQSLFSVQVGSLQQQFPVDPVNYADYNGFYARAAVRTFSFAPPASNQLQVQLSYNRPGQGTRGWLNYLVVNVERELRFRGGQLAFRDVAHSGSGHVLEYTIGGAVSGLHIWDVSNIFDIRTQEYTQTGTTVRFRAPGDSIREFVAFDSSSYLSPRLAGHIPNQNLHAMQSKDLIILVYDDFVEEAERLSAFRSGQSGLSTAVVTTSQVYNEFSSGTPDAAAIRNFMRMFYRRAARALEKPRYLLLFGSGTWDNKDLLGHGGNLIPTYQSEASLSPRSSYMTDDFFGLLDEHEGEDAYGILDIGIGRLPVRTPEEARIVVDKIIRYEQRVPGMEPGQNGTQFTGVIPNYADWRNMVVFIADDGDYNTHLSHAEILAGNLRANHPRYNIEKIYLDAYQQVTMAGGARYPDVNRAINDRVNKGALMINYIGHGGTRGLAHQRVVTFEDISQWENKYNMPVFMTATCEFSSFDQPDPEDLSAGMRIVLKPEGGTIALYTTTRLAWSGSNLVLNRHFMDVAFSRDEQGQHLHLGDLIRMAKERSSGVSTPMQLRNFVLLGDPSMQMAYPELQVVTESMPDTIRALEEVVVSGYITDHAGKLMDGYNGFIYPTVYDKESTIRTLANNHPFSLQTDFSVRNTVLYKGKATVNQGVFSFSFMVPKDISYAYGEGRISYYLDNANTDGSGYHEGFTVGGTHAGHTPDHQGPDISLFMNDTLFVSGDHTHENPVLLAYIADDSGINMTGRVGHDIVAFLNGNTSEPIRLNNYYESDLDTYRSGRVVYPFRNLPEGPHQLSLRAWDVHNNPGTATIDFVVARRNRLILESLINYPNPVSHETWFTFNFNQSATPLTVRIDIFDLQGRLVNTILEEFTPTGYRPTPIYWNGLSNDGRPLANGMYVYRVQVNAQSGEKVSGTGKLLIMK